jgi:membrane-bound metal-dependent hydrolase YbcI (DUF457 family)
VFVGHATLAFALAAVLARRAGLGRDRALAVGVLAGAFAVTPDLDVVYAPIGLFVGQGAGAGAGWVEGFWTASAATHRGATHSLVVGAALAGAASGWTLGGRPRIAAAAVVVASAALTVALAGALAGTVVLLAGVGCLGLAGVAARRGVDARVTAGAALVGLLTHPFGDLFTGRVPPLLFPLSVPLPDLVVLSSDPTVHLLGAMGVELAALWAGVVVAARLSASRVRDLVSPGAALGVLTVPLVLALAVPPPTLAVSYRFVFLAVGVGAVAGLATLVARRDPGGARTGGASAAVTGLAAVTLGTAAYLAAYLAG